LATRFLPSIKCRAKIKKYTEILERDDFISHSINGKLLNIWGDLTDNEDFTFHNTQKKKKKYKRDMWRYKGQLTFCSPLHTEKMAEYRRKFLGQPIFFFFD
jgi:hypothetical protein